MKYMGSKRRISQELLLHILNDTKSYDNYIEPFVGGANMIENIDVSLFDNVIGYDINKYLIETLKVIRDNPFLLPKDNTSWSKEQYNYMKNNINEFDDHIVGFIGHVSSFGSKFFGGYAKDLTKRNRDYISEGYISAMSQHQRIQNKIFKHCDYQDIDLLPKSVIYCDPPYRSTSGYNTKFNHDNFYDWVRGNIKYDNIFFISEYNMPNDFIEIHTKDIICDLTNTKNTNNRTEKLFVHESQYDKYKSNNFDIFNI